MLKATFIGIDKYADSTVRELTGAARDATALWALISTVTFGVLYVFFVIGHDRRRILHFNVTRHPTSTWIVQQLREAFPYKPAAKFLILDHDSKYGTEVPAQFAPWISRLCGLPLVALGRTVLPSAGWEAAAANCWAMGLLSTRCI